jgi:hypothetical protein
MIGNAYQLERLSILVINRIRDIYIVALQKSVAGTIAQFPFVPVHTSVVEEFVSSAEQVGTGVPSSIEESFKLWEKYGSAYFTIPPKEIWSIGISLLSQGKSLQDFAKGEYFLFPPVFPATRDTLIEFEGATGIVDHKIGEKSDVVSN